MGKVSLKLGVSMLMVCGGLAAVGPADCAAQPRLPGNQDLQLAAAGSEKFSLTGSITSSIGKLAEAVTPKTPVKPAPDAVSLSTEVTPTAKLYVNVARLYEQSGRLIEAAKQYEKALKQSPTYLGALLGYARLKDRLGKHDEAAKLYLQAAKAHPNEASVFNNLGTFYGRRGMLNQATNALKRAIELQPRERKYRNNMAIILVEMGRNREAFEHLRAVSPQAVAHYNLGFLLSKKGQTQSAAQQFALALRLDPSMVPAKQMLQRVTAGSTPTARLADQPQAPRPGADPRLGSRPMAPSQPIRPQAPGEAAPCPTVRQLPPPPRSSPQDTAWGDPVGRDSTPSRTPASPLRPSTPRRLPPTAQEPASGPELPPLPTGSFQRRTTPVAPLPPPPSQGPAARPPRSGN